VGTQRYHIKQGPVGYRDKAAAQGGSYSVKQTSGWRVNAGHGLNLVGLEQGKQREDESLRPRTGFGKTDRPGS